MKKKFFISLMVLALISTFAVQLFAQEEVTLRWSGFYSLQDRAKSWPIIVEEFKEKYPNINIEIWAGSQGYQEALSSQFAADDPPDITGLQHTRFYNYVKRDLLTEITDFYKAQEYDEKLYGLSRGWVKYNGKIYGVSDNPAPIEWYYNTKIFNELGLEEPRTLEDLITVGKKIKEAGISFPILWGSMDEWTNIAVLGMITAQTTGLEPIKEAYETTDWNINGLKKALRIIVRLRDEGLINPLMTGVDYSGSTSMFMNGQAAIYPMGSWEMSTFENSNNDNFNYNVFKNPVMFVDDPISLWSATGGQIHAIPKSSQYKEEALKFLEFLFSEEMQNIYSEEGKMVSSLPSVNVMFETNPVMKRILLHLKETNDNSGMLIDYLPVPVMDSLGLNIKRLINGEVTPEQVMENVTEAHKKTK